MNQQTVLVTGHQGYIGSVMVPVLQAAGHDVIGLDTDLYCDADCGTAPKVIDLISCDLRDIRSSDLKGIDAVMHFAALSNDPLGNFDPGLTYDINHRASVDLAKAAKEAGVKRFLFSSSCSMYGASGDTLLDESAELNPITPYGESKIKADREISSLACPTFCPTFLRNATAYGFSPRLRLDIVVNDFAAAAFLDKKIYIKSDGTPWRPLVHIRDICAAFVAVLHAPQEKVFNEAFNIGATSENYRVSELAAIVQELIPDCAIEYDPNGGPDKRCYRVSCDKLRTRLPEFQCEWNVKRGVEELLTAFRHHNLSREDVVGKKYLRLAGLERRMREGSVDDQLRPLSV